MKNKFYYCLLIILVAKSTQNPVFSQLADQGIITSNELKTQSNQIFFEVGGIVSMEAEHASYINGWKQASMPYDTKAMEADSSWTWKGGVLRFDIEFANPGRYAVWILARKGRQGQYNCNDVKVWLDRNITLGVNPTFNSRKGLTGGLIVSENYQTTPDPALNSKEWESELNIPQHYYIWSSNPKEGEGPAFWEVKTPGKHHIEFVMGDEWEYSIDKVVLSLNNKQEPQGRGPAETITKTTTAFKYELDPNVVLPPAWAFGILYGGYTNQAESMDRVKQIIARDYPIDAYWIDSWFWDFTNSGRGPKGYINFKGDSIAFPDPGLMWSEFEKEKVKAGIWIWDIILKDGNETVFEEFRKAGAFANEFKNTSGWHNYPKSTIAGQVNFEDTKAVDYFQQRLKPLFDQGLDFLKLDRNSGVPFAKGVFETIQKYGKESKGRAFIMQHVGDLSDPAYKRYPAKWTGDSEMFWDLPDFPNFTNATMGGYKQNVEMVAWPKRFQYDVPFLTHDAAGFRVIGSNDNGEELFIRWIQFSLFNPITEIFQSLFNSQSNLAWKFSPRADSMFREYAHLRMRLFPYIYSYAHLARQTGQKMIQGDGVHPYQYLFGNELLVGPVVEKGATTKEMFFPEGKWIDFYSRKVYEGSNTITVEAPLLQIPIFVRAGAIIPLRDYARSIELGNNKRLTLDIYPSGKSSFTMCEDDGVSNDYLDGKFSKTSIECQQTEKSIQIIIFPVKGQYIGMPDEREWNLKIHCDKPVQTKSNSKKSRWEYDESSGICKINFKKQIKEKSVIDLFY